MKPVDALEKLRGYAADHHRYEPDDAELLREALRRDWAVRVLDAYADKRGVQTPALPIHPSRGVAGWFECRVGKDKYHAGPSRDAARHAAALAVFQQLPAEVRAQLGECP